jgi:alpha-tubulin suppressor-like RCC1 family protein
MKAKESLNLEIQFCKINAGYTGGGFNNIIDSKGRLWGWGNGVYGLLANNDNSFSKCSPVKAIGRGRTFCEIIGNIYTVLALDKYGRAWGWGANSNGQIGDGTITSRRTPVSLAGAIKTFCQISTNIDTSSAIDKNGQAWGWSLNSAGQIGNNSTTAQSTPVTIVTTTPKTFCKITNGVTSTFAIDKNGKLWAWGNNANGRLGDGTAVTKLTPVSVYGNKTFCEISSAYHSLAIDKNGALWSWGANNYGELGIGSTTSQLTPVRVSGAGAAKTFCKINTSTGQTSFAIDKNGQLWTWGFNFYLAIGDGSDFCRNTPVSVGGQKKTFCEISGSLRHTLAIDKYNRAWAWGYNIIGELGNKKKMCTVEPELIQGASKAFIFLEGFSNASIGLDNTGKAWAWGRNDDGVIGINSRGRKFTPSAIYGNKSFCRISNGANVYSAIDKNGQVWSWGGSNSGRLGDGSPLGAFTYRSTPVAIAGQPKTFCEISVGSVGSLAIDKYGKIWGWGSNSSGSLGINQAAACCAITPVPIYGNKTFCKVAAYKGTGNIHSLAIDNYGKLWAWGNNTSGQLGINTAINSQLTPVAVLGEPKIFCKITNGYLCSFGIDNDGQVWAWGYSRFGTSLGINENSGLTLTPKKLYGSKKTFCEISSGGGSSLGNLTYGIDKDGQLWRWGKTPVAIFPYQRFCKINAATNYQLAIDTDGRAWAWGDTQYGSCGHSDTSTPIRVCNI